MKKIYKNLKTEKAILLKQVKCLMFPKRADDVEMTSK